MAHSLSTLPRPKQHNHTLMTTAITLASWRLRRTWFLLCMTTLGIIAAIVVASAMPLFTAITTTAGLRNTLRASAASSEIGLSITPLKVSTPIVRDIQNQFAPIFQHTVGPYLQDSQPQLFADALFSNISLSSPRNVPSNLFAVEGASLQQAASHITLISGHIPTTPFASDGSMNMLITPNTAFGLGVHVGSSMTLDINYDTQAPTPFDPYNPSASQNNQTGQTLIKAHVVGLFTIGQQNLDYWHGQDFEPHGTPPSVHYTILTPLNGFLNMFDTIAKQNHTDGPYTVFNESFTWYYHINPLRVSVSQLGNLRTQIASLQSQLNAKYADAAGQDAFYTALINPPTYPYIVAAQPVSQLFTEPGIPGNLEQYQSRVQLVTIPVFLISLQILALLLFFVSMMTGLVVEREFDTIALLRSRGASRRQVFTTLFTQCIGLAVIAVIIGIPLALLIVPIVARNLLPSPVQDALTVVTAHPLQATQNTLGYVAIVVLVVLITMSFSLVRAARMDVLATRRSASRSTHRPLWQRLRLDVLAGIIALVAYLISLYLTSVKTALSPAAQALIVTPLSLIAPFFLVIGGLLLFLRYFPIVLQGVERVAVRGRSAISMLALAQMSRAPFQTLRMTLLLALATAFALFSLVFNASQQRNVDNLAAYQTGADFSGTFIQQAPLNQEEALYQHIPGILGTSIGYAGNGTVGSGNGLVLEVRGVNSSTYSNVGVWPSTTSSQSLPSLMNLLTSKRQQGIAQQHVPVIVDAVVANKLDAHIGLSFTITMNDSNLFNTDLPATVVAIVSHIPTTTTGPDEINATNAVSQPTDTIAYGGVLLDYQTYNTVYGIEASQEFGKNKNMVPLNYVWLRTRHDAASLANVRRALNGPTLYLANLNDRFAILDRLHTDPLALTLSGLLAIGTVAALVLAILGDLLASWLSARTRLTNFAVLRALGTSPRQVAGVLIWEQGLIYLAGLLLGTGFGLLLAVTVIPPLIANTANLQSGLSAQLVLPLSLIGALPALIVVFTLALYLMVRVVSRPSLSQTLRLNED